jgi:outer membrane protein OmpA-like peptidoglycan-associated protein
MNASIANLPPADDIMVFDFKMRSIKVSNEISQKPNSITWGIIVITIILLSLTIGYIFYNFTLDHTSRWATEEVALKRLDISAAEIKMTPTQNKNQDQSEKSSKKLDTMKLPEKIIFNFELNSNELTTKAYRDLDGIAQLVTKYPGLEIIIEGYTDSLGSYSYNKKLSKFRAEIIKKYFVGKGIDRLKITAVGHGAKGFIATNDTEEGRRLNRRVEIKVKAE